ncbi:ADENINE NUCLEOTIDE ALPHA HYDROLASES-LIKE SUPERFAMILY PROTEIN [Salix viminalis]|uniref:ADENINE NUCLEOTIDE ALPHA HYDROLASES-LIKE SUPERFAMILY PROTEIN n=1 Tax=Salix viminalis TaxID=40686 RepID=A0A9Q0NK92_SALVM|nr:ADENINE NUCLEOTIDE ALPHA HYDROLASES-LIKE SUPERFAMILY PROTEIN [Salix viminalis]
MEVLQEDEEYNWREVRLPSMIRALPEPDLERETGERRRGRDILIAVDHGPNSKHAFDWALIHLCRLADTIHLVHAGSASEYCFHHCKVAPVIVVPGKGDESVIST